MLSEAPTGVQLMPSVTLVGIHGIFQIRWHHVDGSVSTETEEAFQGPKGKWWSAYPHSAQTEKRPEVSALLPAPFPGPSLQFFKPRQASCPYINLGTFGL